MLNLTKNYLKKDINELNFDDISKLQELIKYHSDLYYNKETPIISDNEYDIIFKKLKFLEEKYGVEIKQTNEVGSKIKESTFKKVPHSRPMISLDNTYNEEDLRDFDERVGKKILWQTQRSAPTEYVGVNLCVHPINEDKIQYTLEFKFDGLGVELIYKDGILVQGITRGDGVEGEDVTENIMQIDNIPKKIDYKEHLEVRGEVIMPISSFEKLNDEAKKNGGKVFSNPRNAASGSVRLLDSSVTKQRNLKFFAYDLANFDDFVKKENIREYYFVIKNLEKLGFEISSYFLRLDGIDEVIKAIENFGEVRNSIDFDIDGLVIKVNNIDLWNDIGFTEHHPRYAIAYKFPAEIFTTTVLSIEHSVGRTGTITPVANLEPVNINGVIVKRATLHNYEEIENLDVRIGDRVFIKRAGEVIPKIISVVKDVRQNNIDKILPPEFCPSCHSQVIKDEEKVRFYCSNSISCPAQNAEKLIWSIGKQGFDIDGFGEKQVKLFLNIGIIHNLIDIFNLKEKKDEILCLEGFQEKSVNNLIESIEKAKNIDIARFLTALGIPGVGKKTAKTLSKIVFSANSPLLIGEETIENLMNLDDIGPEIAHNVIEYFKDESNIFILNNLKDILNITYFKEKQTQGNNFFSGKKFCITGSFSGYTREQIIEMLEKQGSEFVSSVSKNLDFLIAGESAGSKLKKAQELKVDILSLGEVINNL